MKKNYIEELKWRGMLQDIMPGTEELLQKEMVHGYIGFDPTADSLGIGNMVQIMTLLHFQQCGHKPIALIGGATGMVGDPSGKSEERNLLNEEILNHNLACQKKQLEKFLNFNSGENSAEIVNNYDWFKNFSFLDFIRDVGKHITVNYMMAKDSVKKRLEGETGMSFTEFTYQLVQGYDFYWLWKNKNIKLQMGGSDQWGNIVTGTELIRRKEQGTAFALTTPLIKKADGTKFGKTESGNIWLDPARTSPYQFYQFWLNAADADVKTYIRIFSLKGKEEIEALEKEHLEAPHLRILQKELAKEITTRVHSKEDFESVIKVTEILFNPKLDNESLKSLGEPEWEQIINEIPAFTIRINLLENNIKILDLLTDSGIFPSKSEARRSIEGNAIQINKQKITEINASVNYSSAFLNNYFFIENGKKNKYVVVLNDLSEVTKVKETIKVEIDNLINEIIDTSKKSGIGELFYFIYMVHMLRVSQTVPKNDTKYSDKIFFLKVNDAYEYILQVLAKYCSNDFVKDTTNDLVINQNYTEKLLQLSIKVNSFYEVISMVSTSEDVEFLDTKDKVLRFKLKNTKTNIKLKNIVEYGIRLEKAIFIKKDNIKLREELLNQFILEYSPYSDLFEYEFGINLEEFRSLIDFLCDSILDQMKKIKEYVDYLPTGNVDVLSYKTIMSFSRVFFLEKEYIYNKFGIKIHKILEKLTLNLELLDDHQLNFNIIVRQPLIDINEVFVISPEILLDSLYVNTHYSLLESGKISENYKNRFSGKFMDKISTIAKAYGYEEIGREIDINKGKVQYGDLDLVFKNSKEQFLLVEAKSHSLPLDVYFKDYQATENRLNYLKSNWESKVMNRLNFLERNHQDYGIGHDYKYIIISKMPEIISHFSDLLCFTLDEFEYWLKFDDWSLNFNKLNNEYYQNHKLTLEDLNELNDNLYLGLNF